MEKRVEIGRREFIGAGMPATNGRQNRLVTPNIQSFEMTMSY